MRRVQKFRGVEVPVAGNVATNYGETCLRMMLHAWQYSSRKRRGRSVTARLEAGATAVVVVTVAVTFRRGEVKELDFPWLLPILPPRQRINAWQLQRPPIAVKKALRSSLGGYIEKEQPTDLVRAHRSR
jgi:hypothetical protein